MRVLLYGYVTTNRVDLLRRFLDTPWDIDLLPDTSDRPAAQEAIRQADAMATISFEPDLTEPATGQLKLIHVPGAGVDSFKPELIPAGCVLCNCYEHEAPIAEYVMLNILRHATEQDRYAATMRQGRWDGSGRHDGAFHDEIGGKTLGIIGYGHIGREVAKRAQAFGMEVIATRRSPAPDEYLDECLPASDLHALLARSDYVVLALPQTPESTGLLDAAALRKLKPTAYLINPSRGPIIDQAALYEALRTKQFAGAALDAQFRYPPRESDIQNGWDYPFHELEHVTLTPHFSAWTAAMVERRWRKIADNLDRLARGQTPQRIVIDKR